MIPSAFDYVKAASVDEAVAALAAGGEDAKVLGGGQSLMPVLRLRLNRRSVLVDVSQVDEMRRVTDEGSAILIGAAVTTHEVMHDAAITGARAAARRRRRRGWPTRRSGTAARSAARALTRTRAGDLPTVGDGARRRVRDRRSRRPAYGAGGGLLRRLLHHGGRPRRGSRRGPRPEAGAGWGFDYQKFHRTAQAWAIVGAAAAVKVEGGTDHRGPGGADQHGVDAVAGRVGRGGARRRSGHGRGDRRGVGVGCRRHQPDDGHPRRRRVPPAPRPGPHQDERSPTPHAGNRPPPDEKCPRSSLRDDQGHFSAQLSPQRWTRPAMVTKHRRIIRPRRYVVCIQDHDVGTRRGTNVPMITPEGHPG